MIYFPQSAYQSYTITFYICAQVDDHTNENTANFGNYLMFTGKTRFCLCIDYVCSRRWFCLPFRHLKKWATNSQVFSSA